MGDLGGVSGWGGIRTHGTRKRTPVFKTGAFDHSATHMLGPTLGVSSPWVLRIVGLSLLPFALQIWTLARSTPIPPARVRQVIGMDVAWVLGSVVLLAIDAVPWTAAGVAALCAVAAVVGAFAVLQALGLRQAA